MADRDQRAEEARKHTALMERAFGAEAAASAANAKIYEDGEGRELPLPDAVSESTVVEVFPRSLSDALYRNGTGKTIVVDPGSFTRPGGTYETGGSGPEQMLCADSNLYLALKDMKAEFYDKNKHYTSGQLYTDRAVLLPDIVFSREGGIKKAGVLVVAEPQKKFAIENHRSERECDNALKRRIHTILHIAAANGAETLIVNAFACGRNGYEPEQVASIFKEWIEEHEGAIPHIVFAVMRFALEAFDGAFGRPEKVQPTPGADQEAEEAEEEGFVLDFELPEGITLR